MTCCGEKQWNRRTFLKAVGVMVGTVAASPAQAMAGPFTRKDFESLVPADKRLRPEWVRSLTERGEPSARASYSPARLAGSPRS